MKYTKFSVLFLVALAFVGTVTTPDIAQEEGFLSAPWRFNVNLYGWLPEAPATIEVDDKELVDVPENLDTILDSLEAAAMFELEVHKEPVVAFANTVYYKGEYDKDFTGVISGARRNFEIDEEVWLIKYGVGYQLGPWNLGKSPASPTLTLYPYAGALYFHDDWKVKLSPGGSFDGFKTDGTVEFNTPIVGLSPCLKLSERWYLLFSFAYGGWDVDDVNETMISSAMSAIVSRCGMSLPRYLPATGTCISSMKSSRLNSMSTSRGRFSRLAGSFNPLPPGDGKSAS